ncbi:MAG TPA: 30S ribosomal protein S8 [Actinomycetota bacterium]|jgi:small subunit ribosomal protein S8|nr:30S ribosomal protein S8 [Actinomycetota bacterium]
MVMTDPIADMLTRIRNANLAYKDDVEMPLSSVKMRVADILVKEGYVTGFDVEGEGVKRTLRLQLKYSPKRERTITGIRRISKPGKRVYVGRDEVPRVLGGLGIAILSTSGGVLTDKQARKQGVGGEVLAYVW